MIVLSLFDGVSCGMMAFNELNIPIEKYYASEIEKYSQQVLNALYPNIIRLGDIIKYKNWKIEQPDIIIGGSPCQGFSFAGKRLNFEDGRSKLFFIFTDILKKYKPKYFLLENVNMEKKSENIISEILGQIYPENSIEYGFIKTKILKPIRINSNLVSAQNRNRLYWTNIKNITQPKSMNIILSDIIENGFVNRKKSHCITKHYFNNTFYLNHNKSFHIGQLVFFNDKKYRRLTVRECARLQTIPEILIDKILSLNISERHMYEMLGNGWTINVIKHILSFIPKKDYL